MSLAEKIFQTLFSTTSQTIQAVKSGQLELKKQIQTITATIQDLKACFDSMPSFEQVPDNTKADKIDLDLIWTEIETIKTIHAIELQNLKAEIEALKQVKTIAQPVTTPKIKAKARVITNTQARIKSPKLADNGVLPWSEFQNALKKALKITPKKGIIPVLNTVKIEFQNDTAIISTTDLDNYYFAKLESKHFHSLTGKKILIGRDQAERISKTQGTIFFTDGTDRNESQDNAYTIKANNYKDYIYSLPPQDYPLPPNLRITEPAIISNNGLITSILKSRSAQSTDKAKSILTGTVLVRDSIDRVSIASTDGYKLFVNELHAVNSDNWDEMILNPKIAEFLACFKTHEKVTIYKDQYSDHIQIDLESGERIYTRLICGKYPAFRKILPKKFDHTITINRKNLLEAVIEAKNYVDKKTQVITFDFSFEKAVLKVQRITEKINEKATAENHKKYSGIRRDPVAVYKKETVFCQDIKCSLLESGSTPDTIGFNRSYLEAALKGFDSEKITICMNSEIQPVVISVNKYDERQTMIMPIKP